MSLGNATVAEKTILVIDRNTGAADRLREIIEFMDTPSVLVAAPDNWTQRLGERRLEALFVGADLSDGQLAGLMTELENLDPNVPVVILSERPC